ncbi:MAG TPA: hypothetical protein VJL31_07935 [Gemmatimonadales bacterium]|nr:hypothetical protein [Gemmatimonadales bacterium]
MTGVRKVLWPLVLAGCSGLAGPEKAPTGVLRVFAQAGDDGQYVGRPEATFLNTPLASFPDSRDPSDLCQLAALLTIPVGRVENLDAGDSIAFTADGGTAYLYPRADLGGNTVYLPPATFVSLTPGTAVTFQIPGAPGGFPAATFTGLTAPAITQLSPIPRASSASDSVVVTWAPTGDDSSRFEVSLQFATEGATSINRQVLCQWRDDGRAVIAGNLLSEWATTAMRRIEVSRFRAAQRDLGSGGVLYFLATYDMMPEPAP